MDSQVIGFGADSQADQQTRWPLWSGAVPALAENYCLRPETGIGPAESLLAGEVLILSDTAAADQPAASPGGGTGKTQLAAAAARDLLRNRAIDALIWVNASSRDAVLTGYAQALIDLSVAEVTNGIEPAAAAMLEWLASSTRPWLVVLDGIVEARDLEGLWPQGAGRRVLVTTRGAGQGLGLQAARLRQIGPLSHREAVNFLTAALKDDPDLRLGAPDLVDDLGGLPISLDLATAVMIGRRLDCRTYRAVFSARRQRFAGAWGSSSPTPVLVAWSLAVDRASEIIPAGLAWPLLALVAMLDPDGVPGGVLMSDAACGYVIGRPGVARAAAQMQVRNALTALAQLGLLTVDAASSTRTVRMPAQLQRAVRSFVSSEHRDQVGRVAADAIVQAWPAGKTGPALTQALRDSTATLREVTGGLLWDGGCHPVLTKVGESLDNGGLTSSAVLYWQALLAANGQLLGGNHHDTSLARGKLADSFERAGQPANAIGLYEATLAEAQDALGPGDPATLTALTKLAHAYLEVGRTADAIAVHQRNVTARQASQGPRHPDTIAARASLADCYRDAGQLKEAIDLYERALADRERVQGARHLDTIAARASLAFAYRTAGKMREALPVYARTLADREQLQGPHHRDTLTARSNMAAAYHSARKVREAIAEYERTVVDSEQALGPRDPHTLTARGNLASAYHSARRLADAIPVYERTIADCEAVFGPDHQNALTLRSNLGHAYHTAGRLTDAIAIFQQTLADSERVLGPDHPLTRAARENVDAVTQG
ncbi:MAG: tetratricopeptide repeat protein [Streptosporangiaceae bacterium]